MKDLCSRLPYGVKVNNEIHGDFNVYGICENLIFGRNEVSHVDFDVECIKPYLFPLTNMTEEQKEEMKENCLNFLISGVVMPTYKTFDFFDRYHIDYRGLIEQGLAIDATGLNIY